MQIIASRVVAVALLALLGSTAAATDIDIPYRMQVLDNGLTVIVNEDHKAPVVAVNIWYHVGSKNEVRGRTGFAHLFEHLMFQGSEHHDGEFLTALEDLGATDFNGTTWFDRTNYFQTVPKNALDAILWLESDRMGHFLGSITQAKLDEQRGVVQNEKRQGDNQPYGRVWDYLQPALFPPQHPYSWETIGSMADLEAATLDNVRDWFRAYYGPNNAVLAIAGDVTAEEAFAKAKLYFGDLAPVPPITRPGVWIPRLEANQLITMQDRVPQARVYRAWTGPSWGTADSRHLGLAAAVLAGDKNSRLYQRLVYRDRLASDVSLEVLPLEMAGITDLEVTAQPGVELASIEAAIQEELEAFMRKGPTRRELERVTAQYRAGFLHGIEQVGGFNGKAGILAESMTLGGSPDAWKQDLAVLDSARPEDLRRVAQDWLGGASVTLRVLPYGKPAADAAGADRSRLPAPGPAPVVGFPAVERTTLANGLKVELVPRPGIGFVQAQLVLDGGFAADPPGHPGTASLAMAMLDEGTRTRSTLQISEQLALLGASLGTGVSLDNAAVSLSALSDKLAPSFDIFADVVLNATFPQSELERLRALALAGLRQEKNRPNAMALRVLPKLLYGAGHPYAQPLTGTGTEAAIKAMTREDLAAYRDRWFHPNHATLVVAGDTSMGELRPLLERLFGQWPAGSAAPQQIAPARGAPDDVLYILDRPGADQSVIFVGQLMPPKANPDEFAIQAMNNILGGQVSARINMNLREDKHWSYGAYSVLRDARGQRPYFAYAPVQTDKTAEALQELRGELRAITSTRPPTADELERVKNTEVLQLPGRWETADAVVGALAESVRFGLPDDYWQDYAAQVRAVTLADVDRAARQYLHPDREVWVVVGDRSKIEPGLSKLGFRAIRAITADGDTP
ncbi:MAG: insulinase family protein [Gammaproteobacteria bacterium]|nr:insulinase family protein [Gammaproteobacteria bacterium]